MMWILRYLKDRPREVLLYHKHKMTNPSEIQGFIYADWAGSPFDRRSTSVYSIRLGGNMVMWTSKKAE